MQDSKNVVDITQLQRDLAQVAGGTFSINISDGMINISDVSEPDENCRTELRAFFHGYRQAARDDFAGSFVAGDCARVLKDSGHVDSETNVITIEHLWVHPTKRGKGLGSKMLSLMPLMFKHDLLILVTAVLKKDFPTKLSDEEIQKVLTRLEPFCYKCGYVYIEGSISTYETQAAYIYGGNELGAITLSHQLITMEKQLRGLTARAR